MGDEGPVSPPYAGFRIRRLVDDLPYQGWKDIMHQLLNESGAAEHIDASIAAEVAKFGNDIPIHPDEPRHVLRAFQFFPPEATRVVIIGQDCYPTPGNAMGLCFSVPSGVRCPPSLVNVFSELEREYGRNRTDGDLTDWARQGVLMLNTALTVRSGKPCSHMGVWNGFTTALVKTLAETRTGLCFMLWGAHALNYDQIIPEDRGHLILRHSHPSPLSRKPFRGCGHFGQANAFLSAGESREFPIRWTDSGHVRSDDGTND